MIKIDEVRTGINTSNYWKNIFLKKKDHTVAKAIEFKPYGRYRDEIQVCPIVVIVL